MKKELVIKLRKELHHLVPSDREVTNDNGSKNINIPLLIRINTSYYVDEASSYVFWDDENEILYSIEYNNDSTDPLATICPAQVKAYAYENIEVISARLDKNTLDIFVKNMVDKNLTTETVRTRIRELMQKHSDPRTYISSKGYPSTEKKPYGVDDIVFDNGDSL